MLEVNYVGNLGRELIALTEYNPAIYGPRATTKNTDARRRFAPEFSSIGELSSSQLGIHQPANSAHQAIRRWLDVHDRLYVRESDRRSQFRQRRLRQYRPAGRTKSPQPPCRRGPSDYDMRHRWSTSFLYLLPFFKQAGLTSSVLGHWELGGILTINSGDPFSIMSGQDNSLSGVGFDGANVVGDASIDDASRAAMLAEYFNIAAFQANATGTFGNSGRNILYGPGGVNLDVSLSKTFSIREKHALTLRGDAFNIANKPNFGDPTNTLTSPAFGRITKSGAGRILQISLKYMF